MEYPKKFRLENGQAILVRPIAPADKEKIKRAFALLSKESRYHRFFTDLDHLSESQLKYFTQLDGIDHFALVAGITEEVGVAVARYVRDQTGKIAEIAITVLDDYQNLGIGKILVHELCFAAHQNGIQKFRLFVHPENKRLLKKIKKVGIPIKFSEGVYTVEVNLDEALLLES